MIRLYKFDKEYRLVPVFEPNISSGIIGIPHQLVMLIQNDRNLAEDFVKSIGDYDLKNNYLDVGDKIASGVYECPDVLIPEV